MKSTKSRATQHKCLRSNSNATLLKTFPNRSKSTLNCRTLKLTTIIHSKIQEKLLWNPQLSIKKQRRTFKPWRLRVITWWRRWMARSFFNWIFKLNSLRLIKALKLSKNSHCLASISQSCRLREALWNPQWIQERGVLIKQMNLTI